MDKIKIGIVGLGTIANAVHIPQIQEDDRFQITALCDLDESKVIELGKKLNISKNKLFTNYKDLIDDPDVNVVDITTSNDFHSPIALYTANKGKSYILEKPITMTYNQAIALKKATEENDVKNMVCFSYRYKAAARYCKHLIDVENVVGDITHVNVQYYQSWALPSVNVDLVWRFQKEKTGSGALGDLGSHMLDLVEFMTDLKYTDVISQLGTIVQERKDISTGKLKKVTVDDYSNFLITTDNGASISFQINRLAFGRGNYQRIEIYGTKGALIYKLDEIIEKDELERIYDDEQGIRIEKLNIPEEFNSSQMSSFADIIEGKDDGLSANIIDGVRNQYYLDNILYSSINNTKVNLFKGDEI